MRRSKPSCRRRSAAGLVLVDPPYESLDELKMMLRAFADAYRRWPSGIFLLWYPIRSASQRSLVHARFEALQIPKVLFADLGDSSGRCRSRTRRQRLDHRQPTLRSGRIPHRRLCRNSPGHRRARGGLRGSRTPDARADGTIGSCAAHAFQEPILWIKNSIARPARQAACGTVRCASSEPQIRGTR